MSGGFDWLALMTAGMRGLGMHPKEFWALTPAELAFLLGAGGPPPGMDRACLEGLAAKFPDLTEGNDVR